MAYNIRSFQLEKNSTNPLSVSSAIKETNTSQNVLLLNEIEDSYIPRLWSDILFNGFFENPSLLIENSTESYNYLQLLSRDFIQYSPSFIKTLNCEQRFIADAIKNKYPKSGVSYVSLKLSSSKIKYALLGDNFLFFYNKKNGKLTVYCSMLDKNGDLDLTQPIHCLYNDITTIGKPLVGERTFTDHIVFVMNRDLANWFIANIRNGSLDTAMGIKTDSDFEQLLSKIHSKMKYEGMMFNKDIASLIIIDHVRESIGEKTINLITKISALKYIFIILVVILCVMITLLLLYYNNLSTEESVISKN